jgi:hypothetical protein
MNLAVKTDSGQRVYAVWTMLAGLGAIYNPEPVGDEAFPFETTKDIVFAGSNAACKDATGYLSQILAYLFQGDD